MVSKSQMMWPSSALNARMCPSNEPEKIAPGMAVRAPDCAGLQPGLEPHEGGAAYQAFSPVSMRSAVKPPPWLGSRLDVIGSVGSALVRRMRATSDTAA